MRPAPIPPLLALAIAPCCTRGPAATNSKQVAEVMHWAATERWKLARDAQGHRYRLLIVRPEDGGLAGEAIGDAGTLTSGFAEVTALGNDRYDVNVWTLPSDYVEVKSDGGLAIHPTWVEPMGWRVRDSDGGISIEKRLHLLGDMY
ncbi:MAG: hypothetical protein ACYDCL_23190 [Myxococcales bacterium]